MFLSAHQPSLPPTRIISVVPSQTELLHYLGLEAETIGITKFCVHPAAWWRQKTRVGGTKNLDIDKILQLKPDLIIANKEENVQQQIEMLAENVPVWLTDVNNLDDARQMILDVGRITHKMNEAVELEQLITQSFTKLRQDFPSHAHPLRVCYLIWKDPYMAAGSHTFIHDMLQQAGLENAFASFSRYPTVDIQQITESSAQLVLLSSEPYPFNEKHMQELRQALPGVRVVLVDGEMFSWYGSRLLQVPPYFEKLRQQLM